MFRSEKAVWTIPYFLLIDHPSPVKRSSRSKLPRLDAPCPSVPHRVIVACLNSVHATGLGPFLGQKVTAGPPSMALAPGKGASSGSPGGGAQGREGRGRFLSQQALPGLPGTPRPSAPPWKDSSTLTAASSYSSHREVASRPDDVSQVMLFCFSLWVWDPGTGHSSLIAAINPHH